MVITCEWFDDITIFLAYPLVYSPAHLSIQVKESSIKDSVGSLLCYSSLHTTHGSFPFSFLVLVHPIVEDNPNVGADEYFE